MDVTWFGILWWNDKSNKYMPIYITWERFPRQSTKLHHHGGSIGKQESEIGPNNQDVLVVHFRNTHGRVLPKLEKQCRRNYHVHHNSLLGQSLEGFSHHFCWLLLQRHCNLGSWHISHPKFITGFLRWVSRRGSICRRGEGGRKQRHQKIKYLLLKNVHKFLIQTRRTVHGVLKDPHGVLLSLEQYFYRK